MIVYVRNIVYGYYFWASKYHGYEIQYIVYFLRMSHLG